jgi:hypothetical protein
MLGKVDLNKIDRDQQWEEVKRNEVEREKKSSTTLGLCAHFSCLHKALDTISPGFGMLDGAIRFKE